MRVHTPHGVWTVRVRTALLQDWVPDDLRNIPFSATTHFPSGHWSHVRNYRRRPSGYYGGPRRSSPRPTPQRQHDGLVEQMGDKHSLWWHTGHPCSTVRSFPRRTPEQCLVCALPQGPSVTSTPESPSPLSSSLQGSLGVHRVLCRSRSLQWSGSRASVGPRPMTKTGREAFPVRTGKGRFVSGLSHPMMSLLSKLQFPEDYWFSPVSSKSFDDP